MVTIKEQLNYIYITFREIFLICLTKIKKKIVSISASGLEKIQRLRKQIVENAKKHPCIICNKDFNPVVMDLIHVDPSPKLYSLSKLLTCASYARLKEEIDKCAPICANCNRLLQNGYVELPELIVMP